MTNPTTDVKWFKKFNPLLEERWRYIAFHGGRGGAKSWHFALAMLMRGRLKKLRCLCLREIQKSIKESVHEVLKKQIIKHNLVDYKINDYNIINRITGTEIFFYGLLRNVDQIKSVEGVDIAWVEEAQSVSMESLKYLLPTIRKDGSQIWFSFNRNKELDPVYEKICINPPPNTYVAQINMDDLPESFQLSTLVEQREQDKKVNYEEYLHIWQGEPIGQDPLSILPRTEVVKAGERIIEEIGQEVVGVDPARYGGDEIAMYERKGLKITKWHVEKNKNEVQVINGVKDFVNYDKEKKIKIDLGYMPGVYDHLKAEGYNVIGINFGGGKDSLKEPDKYVNVITEMWFDFKDILGTVQIPNDPILRQQLSDRLYFYKTDDRKMVEPKEKYKERNGGKSPDRADALLLCYYQPKSLDGHMGGVDRSIIV